MYMGVACLPFRCKEGSERGVREAAAAVAGGFHASAVAIFLLDQRIRNPLAPTQPQQPNARRPQAAIMAFASSLHQTPSATGKANASPRGMMLAAGSGRVKPFTAAGASAFAGQAVRPMPSRPSRASSLQSSGRRSVVQTVAAVIRCVRSLYLAGGPAVQQQHFQTYYPPLLRGPLPVPVLSATVQQAHPSHPHAKSTRAQGGGPLPHTHTPLAPPPRLSSYSAATDPPFLPCCHTCCGTGTVPPWTAPCAWRSLAAAPPVPAPQRPCPRGAARPSCLRGSWTTARYPAAHVCRACPHCFYSMSRVPATDLLLPCYYYYCSMRHMPATDLHCYYCYCSMRHMPATALLFSSSSSVHLLPYHSSSSSSLLLHFISSISAHFCYCYC